VQFDSHGDVWDSYFGGHKYTHGTPFRRAVEEGLLRPERSVQLGMRGPLYGPEDLQVARPGVTLHLFEMTLKLFLFFIPFHNSLCLLQALRLSPTIPPLCTPDT